MSGRLSEVETNSFSKIISSKYFQPRTCWAGLFFLLSLVSSQNVPAKEMESFRAEIKSSVQPVKCGLRVEVKSKKTPERLKALLSRSSQLGKKRFPKTLMALSQCLWGRDENNNSSKEHQLSFWPTPAESLHGKQNLLPTVWSILEPFPQPTLLGETHWEMRTKMLLTV